ncbi:MAG: sulfurtransferase [Spirulinaceae cyanobacterium RM2_2_10]|nr:sulfurtransferase [Spirulinaceae cyanobacterium SM2_1_0]NJO21420.1 sulfurtransferase [Spirulinaceae cyanobacterium RM2_2_10]
MALVVSADWLAARLEQDDVAIADCRFTLADPDQGEQQYREQHIPGAHYLHLNRDLSAPVGLHGGRHPLPAPGAIAAKLAACGVAWGKTWLIAYDDSRSAFAARLWWLTRHLGHPRVAVLDGGWSGWQAGGYPTTAVIPAPRPQSFVAVPDTWPVADITAVRQRSPATVLIDSRTAERYRGEQEPIDPIAGHIPGAINLPWPELCTTDGYWQPPEFHAQRWSAYTDQELIVYCGSGVTACANLLSLAIAGRDDAQLYPGGWSDWCSYAD